MTKSTRNKSNKSVTIGIPAYNEEANIGNLIVKLLTQKLSGITLSEVIVVSDGSTDGTIKMVKSINDRRIKLVINKRRIGLNASQNIILRNSNSDILVLLDADVLPKDDDFLIQITKPIKENKADLVSCKLHSIRGSSFYGRMITNSNEMKRKMYQRLPNPNNIYLCNGCERSFSRKLYKKIVWPNDVPEDAYSYLYSISNNFKFKYLDNTVILFHPTSNFNDHWKQHKRFVSGIKALKKYFSTEVLNKEYFIPKHLLIKMIVRYIGKRPLSIPLYLLVMIAMKLRKIKKFEDHSKYEISTSSKQKIYV